VPLAVLEAVRNLDTPVEDGLAEFAEELLVKRLGLSRTVQVQLAEYEGLARRDRRGEAAHVEALLRVVGGRPGAGLVFAGGVRRTAVLARAAARAAPRSLGYVVARGAARAVFGGELKREQQIPVVRVLDPMAVNATPDGSACGFYAAGFTELLRLLVGFEGAM